MNITWQGNTTFTLANNQKKITIDPQGKENTDTHIYTKEQGHEDTLKDFDWPGEYEVGGIGWTSIPYQKEDGSNEMMYVFDLDYIKVCHLGNLDTDLDEKQLEAIGDIDILIIPLGENKTLSVKKGVSLIEKIEPRIVIPMLFNESSLSEFKKEFSIATSEELPSLNIKKSALPLEETQFIFLKQS